MVDPETLAELHRRIDALRWTLSQALNVLSNPDRPRKPAKALNAVFMRLVELEELVDTELWEPPGVDGPH